jgi:hypothetical protein
VTKWHCFTGHGLTPCPQIWINLHSIESFFEPVDGSGTYIAMRSGLTERVSETLVEVGQAIGIFDAQGNREETL